MIDALRSASGESQVVVALDNGEHAIVDLVLTDPPWTIIDGRPFEARLASSTAESAEIWAAHDDALYGTASISNTAHGFSIDATGALALAPLPPGATSMAIRHHGDGQLWDTVVRDGVHVPARFDSALTVVEDVAPPNTEYYHGRDGVRVGADWQTGQARAVRCAADACAVIAPDGATASSARAIDSLGRVFGCALVNGLERAFVHTSLGSELLDQPAKGCISGVGDDDTRIGELVIDDQESSGFIAGPAAMQPTVVRVARSWGTHLRGKHGDALLGSVRDVTGRRHALHLAPVVSTEGVAYDEAPQVEDPHLSHACGHTEGPFADIEAASNPDDAGIIQRTHTNYTIARPGTGAVHRVRLVNTREGRATLHLGTLVGVTLREPSGSVVDAAFADTTDLCPAGLRGFVQYELSALGTYVLELSPSDQRVLQIVYERTWAVER